MKKKILITGSNGLLGQKLIHLLSSQQEVEVIATSKGENRLKKASHTYSYYSLDVCNKKEVDQLIEFIQPTIIIHTAAMTNVDDCEINQEACWKLNVEAVQHIVNACIQQSIFLIHLSTDFIFDGKEGPYDEQAIPNPLSYYGKSKLEAEKIIQTSLLKKWAIIRTVLVYGIAEDITKSNIILWVKKSLEEGRIIQVVDDQWRTPTLAEDLAMGCYLIAKKEATGIFNISGKEMLTPYQIANNVADFFNLDNNLINRTDSTQFKQRAARPPKTGFILTKAIDELNYHPHSFLESLAIIQNQLAINIL